MRRVLLGTAILALLPWLWSGSVDAAGQDKQPSTVSGSSEAVKTTEYVGSETCTTCHGDLSKEFASNPHTRLALMHGGKGVTCESCHGSGKAHVESGGVATKIFQFTKATPKQVDKKCLACHVGEHPNFERTAHGEALVSCTSCHSVHKFEAQTVMLKTKQPTLCYQCHTDVKPAFAQPFHHRVNEGLIKCTDCHDPHGTFQPKLLHISATQDAICTKCHIDTLGPFVYEHPPIKTEGCTSCHSPHGSPNPRLLIRSNVNSLCLQCHSPSMNFTAPGTPSFHNQANQYQACTVCHVQIHGSNASSVFFK
jgi:DmsE family decaheme c-type cytochrome